MKYGAEGSWLKMTLTMGFLAVPIFIVGFLTEDHLKKNKDDTSGTKSGVLLGTVYRYWLTIRARHRAWVTGNGEDRMLFYQRRRDLKLFLLYMSLLKSAPQAMLQIYIILYTNDWTLSTGHNFVVMLCLAVVLKKRSISGCKDYLHTLLTAIAFVCCVCSAGDQSRDLTGPLFLASIMLNIRLITPYLLLWYKRDSDEISDILVALMSAICMGEWILVFLREVATKT
ncbi:hypothetical protein MTO96_039487 [Rhipicephalus appendiculatus]